MESDDGVALQDEKCVVIEENHVEESLTDSNKVSQNADDLGEKVPTMNGKSEAVKGNDGLDSSGDATKASVTATPSKNSKTTKDSNAPSNGVSKITKATKDNQLKSANPTSRSQRVVLSQSLSFPARGSRGDGMKKSVDGLLVKKEAKNARENGTRAEPTFATNGTVTSASALSRPSRRASAAVQPKEEIKHNGPSARRATLTSMPSIKQSSSAKLGSVNETANCPPSETSLPVDKEPIPVITAQQIIEEDDAHSTTSTTTPRSRKSGASGFAFRLDERAAKRKEFFTKLEEKIQAKEVEKTNLQAKSKENQEAEIKQLRKSMTFKATPMPNFYREPPPKVELKKIPTTRAISPKLGRNKNSSSSVNNSSEGGPTLSPRMNQNQNNSNKGSEKDANVSKKPIRKSQPKVHSRETAARKAEAKPVKTKVKSATEEQQNQKECLRETEQSQDQNEKTNEESQMNATEPIPHSHEIMPQEVAVGV